MSPDASRGSDVAGGVQLSNSLLFAMVWDAGLTASFDDDVAASEPFEEYGTAAA